MAFALLKNPYFLAGAGGIALLGAAIHQYADHVSKNTGFHFKDTDPSLRIVEKDVVIPKYMTIKAKENCKHKALEFAACVDKTEPYSWARFMTWRTCKKQNDELLECLNSYFTDYDFYLETKRMYLQDKALYQASKVMKKDRALIKVMIEKSESPDELDEDCKNYYISVKEMFQKTGDMDSFDRFLVENRKSRNSVSTS